MKRFFLVLCVLLLAAVSALAQASATEKEVQHMNTQNLPAKLYGGMWAKPAGHLQGIAWARCMARWSTKRPKNFISRCSTAKK